MSAKTHQNQTSEKQVAANRANAQHSTGPTSREGKAAVARNALRHGMYAQHPAAIPGGRFQESEDQVAEYVESIVESLAPRDAIELAQARWIAVAYLRALRFEQFEPYLYSGEGKVDDESFPVDDLDRQVMCTMSAELLAVFNEPDADHDFGLMACYMMMRRRDRNEPIVQTPGRGDIEPAKWREKFYELVDQIWPEGRETATGWALELHRADRREEIRMDGRDEEVAAARILQGAALTMTNLDSRMGRSLERALTTYYKLQDRMLPEDDADDDTEN